MSSIWKQVNLRKDSFSGAAVISEAAPWTSGCYARIAGLETILEIRNRNRSRKLRTVGACLMLAGVATVAAAVLSPF
jgi:hypothetical protein